jgi:hypothetical protein
MRNSIASFVNDCLNEGCRVANLADAAFNVTLPFRPWEVGCTIHIPQTISPMEINFGDDGMPRHAMFIPVQVEYPDGMVVADKLFLATLNKCLQGVDETDKRFYDYANGTANQLLRNCNSWQEFFSAVSGKSLRVAAVRTHNVRDHFSNFTLPKSVYDLDLL